MRWHSAPKELHFPGSFFFFPESPLFCFVSSIYSFFCHLKPDLLFMFSLFSSSAFLSLFWKALLFVPACPALYFVYFTLSLFLSFCAWPIHTHPYTHAKATINHNPAEQVRGNDKRRKKNKGQCSYTEHLLCASLTGRVIAVASCIMGEWVPNSVEKPIQS